MLMLAVLFTLLKVSTCSILPRDGDTEDMVVIPSNQDGLIDPSLLIPAPYATFNETEEENESDELLRIEPIFPRLFMNITIEEGNEGEESEDRALEDFDRATTGCGCGRSIINPASGRIVGGKEVNPIHSRPYQVRIQPCFSFGCYVCGATILNRRYILSAMHCVQVNGGYARSIEAVFGEHDITKDWETKVRHQTIPVSNIIPRSDYRGNDNDIVILKMARDIQFSDYVVPACLPTSSSSTYYGSQAVVSGWGAVSEGGRSSSVLKETTVRVVQPNDGSCSGYNINSRIKMCAYNRGTDSCQGDSGGPLVTREDGRDTVIGVVSYGLGCARPGWAGVYARVPGYLSWINSNIKDGWCGGSTNSPNGPNTGGGSNQAAACDITCTNLGSLTGNYMINGIPVSCNAGKCTATDGTDFCRAVNYPCGKPAGGSDLKCRTPCDLSRYMGSLMRRYQQGRLDRYIDARVNRILSRCDLKEGKCCVKNNPDANLCAMLGLSG
eukprot:TRINITY_DN3913_c0_g1_i13.p1 TRINITY_DN3913_c0_g1~~TRINITY_DN3913_c0_g1_i13.p1  ORF type:complete len:497 (-),score=103.06 TRINITY_DN3913_c0_g1_i13:688-2178(-)